MDFTLTDEQKELRSLLRGFFEREAPTDVVYRMDREERFPVEIYAKMAELGLCGMCIDAAYGGNRLDEISVCIVAEEISRASAALLYAFIPTVTFCARGIDLVGSEEQKRTLLPEVAAGKLRIAM